MEKIGAFIKETGLRKFVFASESLGALTFLTYVGQLSPEQFVQGLAWLVGGMFGANVFEHFSKKKEPPKSDVGAT